MTQTIHILKASKRLDIFTTLINQSINETLFDIKKRIKIPSLDIVVLDSPDTAIREIGVGGFAPLPHVLYISIDPDFPELEETLLEKIRSTLTHEIHHCARWKHYKKNKTLGDALVAEGLADCFDREVNGVGIQPWNTVLENVGFEKWYNMAKSELENETYDHQKWFFGGKDIPRWIGYTIGFQIVNSYLQETGKSAAELVGEPSNTFYKK